VQPAEVVPGLLRAGEDRTFNLALPNQGERLLSGTAISDCLWLSPNDQTAVPEKSFRRHQEPILLVRVLGKRPSAGPRPHEGILSLLCDAGTIQVRVRVAVPSQPFPGGAPAGARTPRELIERVRATPAEAVDLFGGGEVAAAYGRNPIPYRDR
jgi:hypothetical protein